MSVDVANTELPTRLEAAAPHIGAVLAFIPALIGGGVLGLAYFHPIVVVLGAALVATSPLLGAKAVMLMQDRESDWGQPTLKPYVWWSVAAMICFGVGAAISLTVYPGVDAPNEAWAAIQGWNDLAGAFQLAGMAISFIVPALRFVMWMIKPPIPIKTRQT